MLRCSECQPLILDHLFGLLEAPEIKAVAAHLSSCPTCAAERAEAAKVHGLISQAAKMAFPAVKFEAPDARPAAKAVKAPTPTRNPVAAPLPAFDAKPPTTPAPAKPQRSTKAPSGTGSRIAAIIPWAVAAAVLIAIPGTVVPVSNLLSRAEVARNDAAASTAHAAEALKAFEDTSREVDRARDVARRNLATATQAHDALLAKWVADEKNATLTQDTRKLTWEVMKPAAVQPGAPNEFLLVVRDRGNTPAGNVVAEFRDQTDAVIYSQPIKQDEGSDHPIRLPANAWTKLKPESELFLVVSRVDEKTNHKTILQDKVRLLGPVFTSVLTTDKPTYWPGETVHFRSLTLDRVTFTPPGRDQILQYELHGPNGGVVRTAIQGSTDLVRIVEGKVTPIKGPDGNPVRGVGTGEFSLPLDAPEGNYTIVMREIPQAGSPPVVPFPVSRTIKIESGVPEIYRKEIGFTAASYSAGSTVEGWVEVQHQKKPLVGAKVVSAIAVIDEQVLEVLDLPSRVTDATGRVNFRFTLPEVIRQGDVRLKVTFQAVNGKDVVEEMVADRVPVIGPNLIVEFFPEGGDLVAGVPCRVYVRATTPTGVPVDINGTITDGRQTVAEVATVRDGTERGANRGLGVFEFTPELGTPLWLKLASPKAAYSPLLVPERSKFPSVPAALVGAPLVTASRTGFLLPKVMSEGVVMKVHDPVTEPGAPIRVHLRSVGRERNLVVGAYTRGRLSDTRSVTVKPGLPTEVQLLAGSDARGGVVRVTVFEDPEAGPGEEKQDLKPVAERLVFRKPGEALNLKFNTTGNSLTATGFTPGSMASLNITATDENRNPTAAILYAAVVNSAVATCSKDRMLNAHFLIAGEVKSPDSLEYADFLLSNHELAAKSLDMVLATQGWRRFAEQIPTNYVRKPVAPTLDRANLLVCNGQYLTSVEPASYQDYQKLRDMYWPRYEAAVRSLDAAKAARDAAEADRTDADGIQKLAATANTARKAARVQAEQAEAATLPVERFRETGWYAVGGFSLLAVMLSVACFVRTTGRLPLGIGTMGSVGLVAFLVVALGTADKTHAAGNLDGVAGLHVPQLPTPEPEVAPDPRTVPAELHDNQRDAIGRDEATNRADSDGSRRNDIGRTATKAAPAPNGPQAKGAVADQVAMSAAVPGAPVPAYGAGPGFGGLGGGGVGGPTVQISPLDKNGKRALPPTVSAAKPGATAAPGAGGGLALGAPLHEGSDANKLRQSTNLKWLSDGGWQPGKFRKAIPDELLQNQAPYFLGNREAAKQDMKKFADAAGKEAGANGMALSGAPMGPRRGGGSWSSDLRAEAKAAADGKNEKPGDQQYRKDIEAAQKYTEKRAEELQKQLTESMNRQREMKEKAEQERQLQAGEPKAAQPAAAPKPVAQMATKSQGGYAVAAEDRAIARVREAVPTVHPLVVREYAAPRPGTEGSDKDNASLFESDTILWQPIIVLPQGGKLTLDLQLGNSQGGYEVIIAGHTLDGRIGAVRGIIPIAKDVPPTTTPTIQPGGIVTPNKP